MKSQTYSGTVGFRLHWIVICIFFFVSCQKLDKVSPNTSSQSTFTGNSDVDALMAMNAPNEFQFKTQQQISLDIKILAKDNSAVKNAEVKILDAPLETGGKILHTCFTNNNGKISGNITLPAYLTQVVVDPGYPGIIHNAVVSIISQTILCTLGGSNGYSGNVVPGQSLSGRSASFTDIAPANYVFMGLFDNLGKPVYLDNTNETFSNDFFADCNYSLPTGKNLNVYHPAFLSNNVLRTINVTAATDVWFSFVSESSIYTNSIAYFTYPTATPPNSIADIDSLHIILPNATMVGKNGEMSPGNRVNLGKFSAGTSIGFALIVNGWNGTTVGNGNNIFYTVDNLNPESQTNLQAHAVLLYDKPSDLFVVGMEDTRRDVAGCNNDFDNELFVVESSVANAISNTNVAPIDTPTDSDGDGVSDMYDQFPLDARLAYKNYFPAQNSYSTIAFEDLWPYTGDYDMNDLVVEYNYTFINNSQNQTIAINASFIVKAAGCAYHNGFGVEFPFAANTVQSVTGGELIGSNLVTLSANGCESGQSNAVMIPFDDAFAVMNSNSGFNTYSSIPFITPDTINMVITFNAPMNSSSLGVAPFNPFIIINQTRGREVHLPGCTPTQKADARFFGTGQDNTNPAANNYYKSNRNLPWAISFHQSFAYPAEGKAVNAAYLNFISWAQSNGSLHSDWYTDSTNMVMNNIYQQR